jgi:hypothetical protein
MYAQNSCNQLMLMAAGSASASDEDRISFKMVAANACLPGAEAKVQIISDGEAEDMIIVATGLPPNTAFDFFVIQVPKAPFGLSWYQGDMHSDDDGDAVQHFRGRFSIETFIVAPGVALAPLVFNDPSFPDAAQNPATPRCRPTIWALVQLAGTRAKRWVPKHGDAVQWRAQCWHSGLEHVELP